MAYVVGLGVLLFLCLYLGFRTGLRLGMRASRGLEPAPIRSPAKIIKQAVENKAIEQAAKQEADEWESFENCDGYTDEERAWINKGGGE